MSPHCLGKGDSYFVHKDQIWYKNAANKKVQLTHGAPPKSVCCQSPDGKKVAYFYVDPRLNGSEVGVVDLKGKLLWRAKPAGTNGRLYPHIMCAAWIDSDRFGIDCLGDTPNEAPNFVHIALKDGKTVLQVQGGYAWSPDRKHIANTRVVEDKPGASQCIRIDDALVYPSTSNDASPGSKISVHKFQGGIAWSPDNRRIAVIDVVSSKDANKTRWLNYKGRNDNAYVVIAEEGGRTSTHLMEIGPENNATVKWKNNSTITYEDARAKFEIPVPPQVQ